MGLFDKIKDNAKTISMKAIESTREYDEDYVAQQASKALNSSNSEPTTVKPTEEQQLNEAPLTEQNQEQENENKNTLEEVKEEPTEAPVAVKPETKEETPEEKPARKSKITEVSKEEFKKSSSKVSYTPHYKSEGKKQETKKNEQNEEPKDKKPETKKSTKQQAVVNKINIVDIAPKKPVDAVKQAIYARERATMAALSTQRRLSGTVPLYSTAHMNFKTRVYIDRIEYSGSFGKTVLPIDQVGWVKLRHGGTGVIIETTESKRVVFVVKPQDRLSFADAIMKVQGMQPKKGQKIDTRTVRIDQLEKFGEGIDEIEKIAKLFDKGIITQEEFDAKKKQILGI